MSYRAIRSMMDLLVTGMIHRTEYDVKTKEPSLCLLYAILFVFFALISRLNRSFIRLFCQNLMWEVLVNKKRAGLTGMVSPALCVIQSRIDSSP